MKILLDMNLSPAWVAALSNAEHIAVHWSSKGHTTATDHEIMAYAKEYDYVILTHDLDFGAILANTQDGKPSVIQLRVADLRPELLARQVLLTLHQLEDDLEKGALITISALKNRLTILPLTRNS